MKYDISLQDILLHFITFHYISRFQMNHIVNETFRSQNRSVSERETSYPFPKRNVSEFFFINEQNLCKSKTVQFIIIAINQFALNLNMFDYIALILKF